MQTKQQKREKALAMQEASSKLTTEQKIAKLDKAFGKGNGAKRERAKLALRLEKESTVSKKEIPAVKKETTSSKK